MIHWTGERVLELAVVVLPGDIRQRSLLPHVRQIAERLQAGTQIELPTVRRKGKWRLLTGADIVAAHLLLQWPQARFRACTGSDLEARMFVLQYERDNGRAEDAALLAEIGALKEQILRDPPKELSSRRRSPLARAAAAVAKATKRDEAALIRWYRRAEAGTPLSELDPLPVKQVLFDVGLDVPMELIERASEVQQRIVGLKDGLSRAMRQLRMARERSLPVPITWTTDREKELAELYRQATASFPRSVCPYCKLVPGVQDVCAECSGKGWIGDGQMAMVPDKFWDRTDRIVLTAEGIKRYADLLPLGKQ